MGNQNVYDIGTVRIGLPDRQTAQVEHLFDFPDVPALPETLLLLELEMGERYVDLRDISELMLGDLGASLQILRLAGREYGTDEGRPVRIEDCISDLGLRACLKAASRQTVTRQSRQRAIFETWAHSREIAKYCRSLADEMSMPISPEEAYLTGLFHELGSLPAVLGWPQTRLNSSDPAIAGLLMAQQWSLPVCVADYFRELLSPEYLTHWSGIVRMAHQLVGGACDDFDVREDRTLAIGYNSHGLRIALPAMMSRPARLCSDEEAPPAA